MSKSTIPAPLRVDLTDDQAGNSQFIETRVIEPLSGWSQQSVRFLLPKEGILDRDAFVSFKSVSPTDDVYFPLWSGAACAIQSAKLSCGGVTLATSQGFNHLHTLKSFFRDPHNRNEKQSKRMGAVTALMVDTTASTSTPASAPGVWGVDDGQDCVSSVATDAYRTNQAYRMTSDKDTTFEAALYLQDVFPLLAQNNLPLGLLDDQISIEFILQPELTRGDRSCSIDTDWVTGVEYVDWKLHVDLIFFDDPIDQGETTMDMLKRQLDAGQQLPFTDMAYIQRNQVAGSGALEKQNISTLLGLDHQVVRRIFASTPLAPNYANPPDSGNAILGNYCSSGSQLNNTLQVSLNSQPYYSSPLDMDASIQNQLSLCYRHPHKCNQALQSCAGQVDKTTGAFIPAQVQVTDKTLNGMVQSLQTGNCHYYGVPLMKTFENVLGAGSAVGRQPLQFELTDTRCATDYAAKTQHIFAECERVLMMKNGKVLVSGS
jgi:hypothetical protein